MNVMKALTVRLSKLLLTLALYPASQAGLIDILRGSGENVPPPNSQRVALVGSAEVKEVVGQVERLAGFEEWKRLTPGTRLEPGQVIELARGMHAIVPPQTGETVLRYGDHLPVPAQPFPEGRLFTEY